MQNSLKKKENKITLYMRIHTHTHTLCYTFFRSGSARATKAPGKAVANVAAYVCVCCKQIDR